MSAVFAKTSIDFWPIDPKALAIFPASVFFGVAAVMESTSSAVGIGEKS
jgi:hypothetical protein